jgi:hypothetical protein
MEGSYPHVGTGDIPSQLFRRVIAHELGTPDVWNWRDQPNAELVDATISDLS